MRINIRAIAIRLLCSGLAALFLGITPAEAQTSFLDLCQTGSPDDITLALKDGASIADRDEDGYTPLMFAAAFNKSPAVINILVKAGASVKERGKNGVTPLMLAVENNTGPEVVVALINAGASAKDRTEFGDSPLLIAAEKATTSDVIAILIKAGASVKEQRHDGGCTPLLQAARYNEHAEVVSALLKAGASVNERVKSIYEDYNVALNGISMESGIKEIRNETGWSALMLAARYNKNVEVINTLIKAGAKVNERFNCTVSLDAETGGSLTDIFGDTKKKDNSRNQNLSPLMMAASCTRNPDVITALLKAGANAKATTKAGMSAFDMAENNDALKGTPVYWALQQAKYK